METGILVFSGRQVPYSYGELGGGREVRIGDGERQPLVPYAGILEISVGRLHGYSQGFTIGPYLCGHVKL